MIAKEKPAARLVKLYGLRTQIEEEIRELEAAMVAEAEAVKKARQEAAAKSQHIKCGTDSGYYRHIRFRKEPACLECLDAHSAAERRRKNARLLKGASA